MQVHETVLTHFSGAQTLSHSDGGQKNFTANFYVHIRYYGSMATTTTTREVICNIKSKDK